MPIFQRHENHSHDCARALALGGNTGRLDLLEAPFVDSAVALTHEVLAKAGIDASRRYLTSTAKHFKLEQRGNARLHKRANASEQKACRPCLVAKLVRVRLPVVIALDVTAAQTLFGHALRLTRERGQWHPLGPHTFVLATWHSLLRISHAKAH